MARRGPQGLSFAEDTETSVTEPQGLLVDTVRSSWTVSRKRRNLQHQRTCRVTGTYLYGGQKVLLVADDEIYLYYVEGKDEVGVRTKNTSSPAKLLKRNFSYRFGM